MTLFLIFLALLAFAFFLKTALDPSSRVHQALCTRCKRRREYMS
jgi:hypothetical protein